VIETQPPEPLLRPRLRGVTHVYGFFVAVVLGAVAVVGAPSGTATFAAVVYALGLAGMFGASALYHRTRWGACHADRALKMDHSAIFVMIAGTVTPIALLAIAPPVQVIVLVAVWGVAAAGIVFEWLPVRTPQGYVTTVYLALGWVGVLGIGGLWRSTGLLGVALVAGGGLLYTAGAIVHAARRPDPWPSVFGYHEIFHAFVVAAALAHYVAITALVLPLGA